jgi:GntP family gluconate:H+ symporter
MNPILILLLGMAAILGAIIVLRLNAFLALIIAAILVSLLAPGEAATKIPRVAEAFGRTAGNIGIVIALAAIIGKAMMESGAADRVVSAFLSVLGEKRAAHALQASGFVLAVPVFFDTVFYLLVPLARSMYTRTNRNYLRYLMAIAAGGVATHTLVPPTPGPLAVAGTLGVDIGMMLLIGLVVAVPASAVGLMFAGWVDRRMPVPFRRELLGMPDVDVSAARPLPGLAASFLPIVLPVLLISANTIASIATTDETLLAVASMVGNANLALLVAALIAMLVYRRQRTASAAQMAEMVETALMSGGVIILITAGGGAFGAMLQAAQIGPQIQALFADGGTSGLIFLLLSFAVASLMKIAQGSSTVAMITTAAMIAAMLEGTEALSFHVVYLATAIASGSMVGSWMNDSGFWVFTKMGGLTEVEGLKSWTPLLAVVGGTAMLVTVLLAIAMPMK